MWKRSEEGSTGQLVRLCAAYFAFYVVTGVTVKYFLGDPTRGFPGMDGVQFLVYNTVGANALCLAVVFARRWYRFKPAAGTVRLLGRDVPREFLYIIPSGICTAVVIPTTTLMYTLPISVMVAMVMMRGSVIVISRAVDAIQIRQGILKKRVYWEEDAAVVLALAAVSVDVLGGHGGKFDFLKSPVAMAILGSYIVSYAIRIYIMNYYKNTRPAGSKLDNQGFFAVEQIAASVVMIVASVALFYSPLDGSQLELLRAAIHHPRPSWPAAVVSGLAYGAVAFFSVFIFMFKGRTATFAGLVNRLTSLVAGTTATLVWCFVFHGPVPKLQDWISLGFILAAVAFLTRAERKRTAEVALARKAAA